MLFRVLVLIMCSTVFAADLACIVDDRGHSANAGFFRPGLIDVSDYHISGGPLLTGSITGVRNSAGAVFWIDSASAFGGTEIGMFINCDFIAVYPDGCYEIVDLDLPNSVQVLGTYVSDAGGAFRIGGALPTSYNGVTFDLEYVLDSAFADASSDNVFIYGTGTTTLTESIMLDMYGGGSNNWLYLIGTDTNYAATSLGMQGWTITGAGTDLGAALMTIDDQEFIKIKNIAFEDNDSNGGTPGAGENGLTFDSTSAQMGYLIENCAFDNCYQGVFLDAEAGAAVIKNCTIGETAPCELYSINNEAEGTTIIGGRYVSTSTINLLTIAGITITDVVIDGGNNGVGFGAGGSNIQSTVSNCSFYNNTIRSILLNGFLSPVQFYNDIFYVTAPASDYAIGALGNETYIEFSNITNADTLALSGFINSSDFNLTFSNTDPFVDAAGGDFRVNWGQTVANANVIDKGHAPYLGGNTDAINKKNVGAYSYQQAKGKRKVRIIQGN